MTQSGYKNIYFQSHIYKIRQHDKWLSNEAICVGDPHINMATLDLVYCQSSTTCAGYVGLWSHYVRPL